MWNQVYNPLNNAALSTICAAIPVITLLVLIASGKVKAHVAAIIAVVLTNLIAIYVVHDAAQYGDPGLGARHRVGASSRSAGSC